ncbi:MAG TPA: hypothetical protein VI669_16110, partial [Vicinamibacteria bacterium]
GYGFGAANVPDNAEFSFNSSNPYTYQERRSVVEQGAKDGSEQTDVYSAFDWYSNPSAPLSQTFDVRFPIEGNLQSATLEIDMGGFQPQYGAIGVAFNGVNQPNLLSFQDGALGTQVRQFTLSPAALANANAQGGFRVTFSGASSNDAVAFDYFRLTGTVQP